MFEINTAKNRDIKSLVDKRNGFNKTLITQINLVQNPQDKAEDLTPIPALNSLRFIRHKLLENLLLCRTNNNEKKFKNLELYLGKNIL